ncbi:MAG: 3-oxoacyl-ACP reductase family protein [Desulfonauticus sp.]|nr:3-oxoacyl-ACP reductase family protein [Desulfonauticus sp.]
MACKKLKGKVALITGASRGIGRAIAVEFAKEGANIIINYLSNRYLAEALREELIEKYNIKAITVKFDISKMGEILKAKKLVEGEFGKINILVNNAGINKPNDFDKIKEEEWDEVLSVNLKGAFLVSQLFSDLISEGGVIINISSVSGQYGGPRTTHYAVSKAGIIALTHNMAIFFSKRKIRVNCIAPGLIESEMAKAAKNLGVKERILLGRLGKPEEVAKVAVFLASDDASYITGQTINVNGGMLLSHGV